MRLGASLFLIAVGAILKFAVKDSFNGVDLGIVGIVLMIVGVVGLIAEIAYSTMRRRSTVVHDVDPVDGQPVVRERRPRY